MITKKEKEDILKECKNSGVPEAQVMLLSKRIDDFFVHMKKNPKDLHSKRGLLAMVNRRRKLLSYLKKEDEEGYKKLIAKVGLKK